MGLDIDGYSRAYSTLQRLRRIALEIEGNEATLEEVYRGAPTKFDQFINHSDCEGGYISFSSFSIRTIIYDDNHYMLGDLDALREEMEIIREALDNDHPAFDGRDGDKDAMEDFVIDVEESGIILQFR